jgi:HEPN domain-containing protein
MKINFLKERAENFLRDVNFAISEKRWNSAAFYLEQACQLYLKYYLFKELKDFPKIHDLDELLETLKKAYSQSKKEIEKFRKEIVISALNQAYITARYLPVEFTETQVKEMRNFTKRLIKPLKKCAKNKIH